VVTSGKPLARGAVVAGAYRVVSLLAEGGMGAIYEAEQIATGARRALKVMHLQFAGDDGLRARFIREARLATAIPSDHIALVIDAGLDASTGALFIVMELLDGATLSQELRRRGAFAWPDSLLILGQVAHALGAAHAQGVVHRDLKPSNVFLSKSRHASVAFTVKLLDFGIAKAVAGSAEATAAVLGTPTWMAPEQTNIEASVGPEADVWSFGLLTFMLLTGRHYFATANARTAATAAILREVLIEPLRPASLRAAEVGFADRLPEGFDGWFARAVDRIPSRRFGDARAAFDALALLPAPAPGESPSPSQARLRAISALRADASVTAVESPHPPGLAIRVASPASSNAAPGASVPPPARRALAVRVAGGLALAGVAALVLVAARAGAHRPGAAITSAAPVPFPVTLRLHGSNTIGSELMPALAQAFLERRTAPRAVIRRRTAPDEMQIEARDGEKVVEAMEVFAHGTRTAFEDLAARRCDIGMASSRIHDDEAGLLAPLGNLMSAASEHVVALDGVAVIVNPANPVSSLTKAQIADLFAGKVQRWAELGGIDAPVVVHARDDRSGTYDAFRNMVLGARGLAAGATRHESSEELSDAVAADRAAVGFIGLPYVRSAKAVMVEDRGGVPLLPSPLTVATEAYPLSRRLYLYEPPGASQVARDFVDFALSEEGQSAIRSAGFVDLRPSCDPGASRCTTCPHEYAEAVKGACRVSLDFRFEHETALDTRALGDLPRVVELMEQPELRGRGLLLVGFSDGQGTRGEALLSSQQRAAIVARQLRARGLRVDVEKAMGAEMPQGDDATEAGRARSRRVEIWVR
jgi:phosphate transport system substrate-binding protein